MITPKERTFYPELPATITSVENALSRATEHFDEFELSCERILSVTSANQDKKECENEPKLQKLQNGRGPMQVPTNYKKVSSYPTTKS